MGGRKQSVRRSRKTKVWTKGGPDGCWIMWALRGGELVYTTGEADSNSCASSWMRIVLPT